MSREKVGEFREISEMERSACGETFSMGGNELIVRRF
jgi:hypothetical protein